MIDNWSESILDIMNNGGFIEEVLVELGMTSAEHYVMLETNPEYEGVIKQGHENCYAWWIKKGRESLRDKTFNNSTYNFIMKNKFGWVDGKQKSDKPKETIFDNDKTFKELHNGNSKRN